RCGDVEPHYLALAALAALRLRSALADREAGAVVAGTRQAQDVAFALGRPDAQHVGSHHPLRRAARPKPPVVLGVPRLVALGVVQPLDSGGRVAVGIPKINSDREHAADRLHEQILRARILADVVAGEDYMLTAQVVGLEIAVG